MAKRKSGTGFILFLLLLVVLGAAAGYVFFFTDLVNLNAPKEQTAKSNDSASSLFTEAQIWVPEVVWSKPKSATQQTYYGTVKGTEITGKIVNRDGYINHTEDPEFLKKLGFTEDLNLSADGVGSSSWGYVKHLGDKEQVVVFSYTNEDMHPSSEGPLEAECPCTFNLSVFFSESFKPNWK